MKAEDLMIGDWVNYQSEQQEVDFRVTEITEKYVKSDFCCDEFFYNEITPITLTDKILEKNGFGYKEEDDNLTHYYLGDRWYLSNPDLHIGTYNKGVYWLNHWDNAIYGIKYVHELQHALRLTGVEKEIEL